MANSVQFATREAVDFVIIGSGSAGGILAKELSTSGFDVVVLEQGPYRKAEDFKHDELSVLFRQELHGGGQAVHGQTFRHHESKTATMPDVQPARYARGVGGSSVHFTANFWRFRELDFKERSLLGPISGTNFADWPISYEELEPYYTKVDWDIGISGAPGPFDAPRSKPFPMPPMPIKSSGVLLEKGAKALGLNAQVEPLAILSQAHNGRPGCISCGFCMRFGCEVGAKSSTLAAMIPLAEASGHCEIRAESVVIRIDTDDGGRANQVIYLDKDGNQHAQKAKAVILSANGAESARLLLMSESSQHPDGLANSSGFVGRNLMHNAHGFANGVFDEPLNDYKGVQVTRIIHDFYATDEKRGFYGGGGIDARPLLSAVQRRWLWTATTSRWIQAARMPGAGPQFAKLITTIRTTWRWPPSWPIVPSNCWMQQAPRKSGATRIMSLTAANIFSALAEWVMTQRRRWSTDHTAATTYRICSSATAAALLLRVAASRQ